jgi:hypothetical protein
MLRPGTTAASLPGGQVSRDTQHVKPYRLHAFPSIYTTSPAP